MKSAMSIIVSLATGLLLACGAGPDSSVDESVTPAAPAGDEQGAVTAAAAVCGDGICALPERSSCPMDCPPVCGDGVCCGGETPQSCPTDCTQGNVPYCYKTALRTSEPTTETSTPAVSATSCTTLWRPRYSSYWSSFPIEVDGQVGGCETHDDCSTSCWGNTESPYYIHRNFFYCSICS